MCFRSILQRWSRPTSTRSFGNSFTRQGAGSDFANLNQNTACRGIRQGNYWHMLAGRLGRPREKIGEVFHLTVMFSSTLHASEFSHLADKQCHETSIFCDLPVVFHHCFRGVIICSLIEFRTSHNLGIGLSGERSTCNTSCSPERPQKACSFVF